MFTLFSQLIKLQKLELHNNQLTELPPTIINLRKIYNISKDDSIKLSDQQKRYFEWIKSYKKTIFDEHCNTTLIKYAGKVN